MIEYLAIDTETNGENIYDGSGWCQGLSISDGKMKKYFPLRHDDKCLTMGERYELFEMLKTVKHPIFHNAKFDLQVLLSMGLDLTGTEFYDTMMMSWILDENYPMDRGLDACLAYHLKGMHSKKESAAFKYWKERFGWVMPCSMMEEYAEDDAFITYKLWEQLDSQFLSYHKGIWERKRNYMVHAIMPMTANGVMIDTKLCAEYLEIGTTIMEELKEVLGGNPASSLQLRRWLIDELGFPIVKLTKGGKPSFDKEAMEEYELYLAALSNPLAQRILAYRGWQKATSTNYGPYLERLGADGRIRTNYKQHGTKTGRLSSSEPNLQNIPKVGEKPWNGRMKECFIPRPGYVLLSADYSQLEFRLATSYAKNAELLEIFNSDRDVFSEMAESLGWARFATKTFTYSVQYGAGRTRIAHVFAVNEARASLLIRNYYNRYPEFKLISDQAKELAEKRGYVKTWTGRRRTFTRNDKLHKAFNSVCQGGAADIVEDAGIALQRTVCTGSDINLLLQVHDEYVLEVPEKLAWDKELHRAIELAMTPEKDFGVKFKIEIKEWGK